MPRTKTEINQAELKAAIKSADGNKDNVTKDQLMRQVLDEYQKKTNSKVSRSTLEARMKELGISSSREFKRGRKKGQTNGNKKAATTTNDGATPVEKAQEAAAKYNQDNPNPVETTEENNANAVAPTQNDPEHAGQSRETEDVLKRAEGEEPAAKEGIVPGSDAPQRAAGGANVTGQTSPVVPSVGRPGIASASVGHRGRTGGR
jgi:hypothetical protein